MTFDHSKMLTHESTSRKPSKRTSLKGKNPILVPVGNENYASILLIVAILKPDSAPAKRLRQEAAEKGFLIDATNGRKTRSMVVLSNYQVMLSSVEPETLKHRVNGLRDPQKGFEDMDEPF